MASTSESGAHDYRSSLGDLEAPYARGRQDPSVDAAPQHPVPLGTIWELRSAIDRGDRMLNADPSLTIPTKRRALL
ncbi:hypothetical protein FRC11_004683, partial [Ceratobasidium sp. 423]